MSPRNQNVTLTQPQQYVIDTANLAALSTMASSTGCTSVGERLMMPSTSECRLMLQCFAQFRVAFLNFPEQPDVLDGDDGLIGESFE